MRWQTVAGFLVHARPFKENEAICTFLTASLGRIQCRLKAPTPELFRECQIKIRWQERLFQGQGFRYLHAPLIDQANASFYGLYVNELVYRLAPTPQEDAVLYGAYVSTLVQLNHQQSVQKNLRFFEMKLLEALGQGIDFQTDANQVPIQDNQSYHFQANKGFIKDAQGRFPGDLVRAAGKLAENYSGALAVARECLAAKIDALLAGRELVSRQWPIAKLTTR